MRSVLALAVGAAFVLAPSSSAEGLGAGRPRVALSVSPARVALAAPASRAIELRNVGAERVVVDISRKAVGRRTAAPGWFTILPRRLFLRSGARAVFTVRVRPPRRAEPGDHRVLVVLTTRPLRGTRVGVRMRLGVVVRIRVPGRVVRRLELHSLHVYRRRDARLLFVSVANRGNVTEQLRGRLTVSLIRRGQIVARLRRRVLRELLPGAQAVLGLRYSSSVRGFVTALVQVRLGLGLRLLERRYQLRL